MRATRSWHTWTVGLGLLAVITAGVLGACGGSTGSPAISVATTAGTGGVVLPVTENPIHSTSTLEGFSITSLLVENNADASGNDVSDHLEFALTNTGTTDLAGFEVFYTIADSPSGLSESYYTRLPDTFTISAGARRIVHFDTSGALDHFAVNGFSLFYTSTNPLQITVVVGASGVATQTASVAKDAGGAETPGE